MEEEIQEVQEPSIEPATEESQDTLDKIPEYVKEIERKNAQLFERTKKAEGLAKDAQEAIKELRESFSNQQPVSTTGDADVDKILEIKTSTEGLDTSEVMMLRKISKVNKISLSDARSNEDFTTWQKGYKQKVEMENIKDNIPPPSTTQAPSDVKKALNQMTFEERDKLWKDLGLVQRHKPPEVR